MSLDGAIKTRILIVRSVNRCDIRLSGIISGIVLPEFANFARGWSDIPYENLISRFNRPEIHQITGGIERISEILAGCYEQFEFFNKYDVEPMFMI